MRQIVLEGSEKEGRERDFAEMAGLGDRDEDGISVSASGGHAAAGDLAVEDTFANDVLAVVVVRGAARQQREGQNAAAQALD